MNKMGLSKYTRTKLLWDNGKRVRAHRLIMERELGRKLLPSEHVHHINHNPLDNRIENLIVMDAKDHISMHHLEQSKYPNRKVCIECGAEFTPKPKKRKRQLCCSNNCAQKIRLRAMMKARGYDLGSTSCLSNLQSDQSV